MLELQVAIFVVLAMVLRRKPDVLINLLPKMRGNPKYQGLDKLPITIWMIAQVTTAIFDSLNFLSFFLKYELLTGNWDFCLSRSPKEIWL